MHYKNPNSTDLRNIRWNILFEVLFQKLVVAPLLKGVLVLVLDLHRVLDLTFALC